MIRKANIWDARTIVDLWACMVDDMAMEDFKATEDEKARFYVGIMGKIIGNESIVLVYEKERKVLGFMVTDLFNTAPGTPGMSAFCDAIYLDPSVRGKGLDKEMVHDASVCAKAMGATEELFETKYDASLIKKWGGLGYKPHKIIFRKRVREVHYGQ